ncbi:GNAT family N-acetyltransferase [Altericroceibacterium endophyticum]|uniref:GNAT family N-acetyltransferase n=1 Tax=Altericroceibacterium endophyticum TaxID=1808508 RepID=A0A6I4T623_9SPHN|nr:GNAT family N-acetyltransferase [Altericroceibacterium endophyticum]MXO65869.1 GNAT family N-acetyltransferase [Altericroceibacterium endophyticum]
MTGLRIRPIEKRDAGCVAALFEAFGFSTSADTFPQRLDRSIAAGDNTLVAERDDAVIGCIGLSQMHPAHRDAPVGRITVLVVAEEFRGAGIGTALVKAAVERFSDDGCTIVEVTSRFELKRAHAFYEKMGFGQTSVRLALTR